MGSIKLKSAISVPSLKISPTSPVDANEVHHVILINASTGNKTVNLPDNTGGVIAGRTYTVKKIDLTGNLVRIRGVVGQRIDGSAGPVFLGTANMAVTFHASTDSHWYIVSSYLYP